MIRRTALGIALALVAGAAGVAIGMLLATSLLVGTDPGESSPEAGFARDMQTHHAQAVEMALLVRDRSDDEILRQVALDMVLTQQQQIGQMHGWLATWGLPQTGPDAPMAWTGHGHGADGAMAGMATADQMATLAAASAVEAERVFLTLMIDHHRGGVDMAEAVLTRTDHPAVVRLAEAIVAAQSTEIEILSTMLDERGGPPAGI